MWCNAWCVNLKCFFSGVWGEEEHSSILRIYISQKLHRTKEKDWPAKQVQYILSHVLTVMLTVKPLQYAVFLKDLVDWVSVWFCLFWFSRMTTSALKSICEVLDLERGGRKEDIVERVLNFLMKPKSSGKALPKPKKSMLISC